MKTSGRSARKRPRPKRQSRLSEAKRANVTLVVEEKLWRAHARLPAQVARAARMALEMGARTRTPRRLTVLLSTDSRLAELNAHFRGRAAPTNVLSFPSEETGYLGDVALAYGVAAREARSERKPLAAHAAHLAVHGVLHLLGYDHEEEGEAIIMEGLETRILARLGLPDPYLPAREAA